MRDTHHAAHAPRHLRSAGNADRPAGRVGPVGAAGAAGAAASVNSADPVGAAGAEAPVDAPGLAALLRRHPRAVRRGAAGAVVAGLVLFAIACVAGGAGADTRRAAAPAAAATTRAEVAPIDAYPQLAAPSAAPAVNQAVRVKHAKPAPADRAVISGLAANGIPNVALNAYRVAAARLAHAEPACGIDWALLAGIGREESDHGRFAGAVLHSDGVSTPRIIGIPLNGQGTALITDTDGGRIDGDPVYDRAVGPMQFIPSTWRAYGLDATGDGRADPFNINDAALTAARYLCAAGGDLRTHAGQVAAVLAYNHSDQYLAQVLALADAYRRGIPVSGVPVGNTTGALPPVSDGSYVPAANPGPPTANSPTRSGATTAAAKPAPTSSTGSTTNGSAGGSTAGAATGGGSAGGSTGGATGGATGGSTSTATPTGGVTATAVPTTPVASPTASPSKVCLLWDLLNPGRCALYG